MKCPKEILEFLKDSRKEHTTADWIGGDEGGGWSGCMKDRFDTDPCDCGADEYNKKLDELLKKISDG